ncbi:hypothetical protein QFC19_007917 [Naganishia cerealis]|uniref:Uncharacterized protein n=1 Tax=Naganishia cerealis TaxID=610337 RepID=A0ACC2V5H3_9TREE|nr:hypothetical protein QFC19_007917 [Naganishia cerealis]
MVHQNDIIDDVKLMIIQKYPNSLGREYDAADLMIKMDVHVKLGLPQPTPTSTNRQRSSFSSPDKLTATTLVTLEPDQNVWALFDNYFPNGMSIHNAFVIEEPGRSRMDSKHSLSSLTLPTATSAPVTTAPLALHSSTSAASPSSNQPVSASARTSTMSPPHGFHLPRPQYNYQHHQPYAALKEMSISPSNVSSRSPSTVHRRSQSNPPQSPVTSAAPPVSKNPNSQAILLLPKNFSLSGGGSSSNLSALKDQKRLSLDEGRVSRARTNSILSPGLANIGIGGVSSPPAAQPSSYPLVQKGPNILPKISTDSNQTTLASSLDLNVSSAPPLGKATSLPEIPTKPTEEKKESSSENVDTTNIELDPESNSRNSTATVPPPVRAAPAAPKKRQEDKSVAMVQKLWKKNPTANERMLPSVSVLVVEDNAINQAILGAFLRRHKIRYQIAKNGQEAVDKWSKGGFHLVLMDIQLPVISGIEATKEIRRLEKINRIGVFAEDETGQAKSAELEEVAPEERLDLNIFRSPVIIVALTASSNSSVDKTNALRAGCNDYLTKPVNLVWLQNKITEWGCMQALIDFEGWKTKRSDEGFNAIKGKAKGVILPSGKLVVSA